MSSGIRVVLLLLAFGLVSGCSTNAFVYKQLDWIIPWYVGGYVDLTAKQKTAFQGQLEPLLRWHRDEELLRYVGILDGIERDLAHELSAATVRGWVDEIVLAVERTERSALFLAIDFGETVSDEQMQQFVDSFWERQREYEAEFLPRSDEQYAQDSYDNLVRVLSRVTGRLDAAQKSRLRGAAASLRRFDGYWLADREAWLRTIEPLLLQRAAGWQARVADLYALREAQRTVDYRDVVDHNLRQMSIGVAEALNRMSAKQRQRSSRQIDKLRGQLRKLADQPAVAWRGAASTVSPPSGFSSVPAVSV